MQFCFGYEAQKWQQELIERRDGGVIEDCGAFGVKSGCEVVEHGTVYVRLDIRGRLPVGDDLIVRQHKEGFDAGLLEPNTLDDCSEIVAEMQRSCRTLAGEKTKALGVSVNVASHLRRSLGGSGKRIHLHALNEEGCTEFLA